MYYYIHDHLGNTRLVYLPENLNCPDIPHFKYELEYAADYYPYGKILREFNPEAEKFLTTHHERDTETGLDYRGARYFDSDVPHFLSLDPNQMDFASWSPYNYVLGNPVTFIDPDGRSAWIPELDDKGNVQYKAEEGDNLLTFKSQYNLSNKDVISIAKKNGFDKTAVKTIEAGTKISGESVKKVTGSMILKLDLSSSDVTDSDIINQVLFAMESADVTKGWYTRDYFGSVDKIVINGDNTKFGTSYFEGLTPKISSSPVNVSMLFSFKEKNPIKTYSGSDKNWLVKATGAYSFQLPTQTSAAYPTLPVTIKFKGEQNMINFSKKYDSPFSGTIR